MEEKIDLLSLREEELKELLMDMGEKSFRGAQIFERVQTGTKSIQELTNLSKELRNELEEKVKITNLKIYRRYKSKMDGTVKYLFELEDGNRIEAVLMKYKHGNSLCISTQVGCAMGCSFCASTEKGLVRNLTAGEMADQVLQVGKDLNLRISNVVLMGIGEPLHNFQQVKVFLENLNHPKALNISNRKITLSTCGLVPEILELAEMNLPINLAVSLHTAENSKRLEIMPIEKKYPIEELIDACKIYTKKTHRQITFEYSLVKDFNDGVSDGKKLAALLKGMLCHVNLIPVNPIGKSEYQKPSNEQVKEFERVLKENRIPVSIRRELGQDINGACGQLRNQNE